jgi:hypothetical protein
MVAPRVNITRINGGLGVSPNAAFRPPVLVGPAGAGDIALPGTFSRVSDLVTQLVSGPLLEQAAYLVDRYGCPVTVVRATTTTAGSAGSVTQTGTGTSVASIDSGSVPVDDHEAYIVVTAGCTIGTAGGKIRWSLDGGRTLSPVTALGTANSFLIPGSGATVNFTSGTLVAGDTIKAPLTAPHVGATDLGTALTALTNWAGKFRGIQVVGPASSGTFGAVTGALDAMAAAHKYRWAVLETRMPNASESDATYQSSLAGAWGSQADDRVMVCAGACKAISAISQRQYRRPSAFGIAPRALTVDDHINLTDLDLGALLGIAIRKDDGNPDEHDEAVNPGLDDLRFATLRTWDNYEGTYVTAPRILSASGSDYTISPYTRVMNVALEALYAYFVKRLGKPTLVSPKTGYILESEARDIETGARAALKAVLGAAPKASAWTVTISRNDNLLSTKTLTGAFKLVPLAYAEDIELTAQFSNPALLLQAA